MTPLFHKLNLGSHRQLLVVNGPDSFNAELLALSDVTVHRNESVASSVSFALVFVQTLAEVKKAACWLPQMTNDAIIWMAYPKGSSKRYQCEFNRDTGWAAIGEAGFEPVRQVAIDTDWSALRFRRPEYIKSMTRDESNAISTAGKTRTRNGDAIPNG